MNTVLPGVLPDLLQTIEHCGPDEGLNILLQRFPGALTFSTSFSYEDQVITHFVADKPVTIFTLDTGRLFSEVYTTWSATREWIGRDIEAYYPDAEILKEFVSAEGPDAFYRSVENRKKCCHIRKVVPLQKALQNKSVWITGLRAEHSPDRGNLTVLEWDAANHIIKYHPLLHWDTGQVKEYIRKHHIPYNILHDRGYVSIGCAPCTRPVKEGENFRAGRWWWEDSSRKECGLHAR